MDDNIEEISKGDFATVYSAIWKNGPLHYDDNYLRENSKGTLIKKLL